MDRVNIYSGEQEDRDMRTGRHTVRDIFCKGCHTYIGWRYVSGHDTLVHLLLGCGHSKASAYLQDVAFEHAEKYKEGKYILERELVIERPEIKTQPGRPRIEDIPVRDILTR